MLSSADLCLQLDRLNLVESCEFSIFIVVGFSQLHESNPEVETILDMANLFFVLINGVK